MFLLYSSSLFSFSDQFYYIDLGLIFDSCVFVSIFITDDGAATAVGDDGAFTADFLFIVTPRDVGNGKVGRVDGSNLEPSGRRVDTILVGGVSS